MSPVPPASESGGHVPPGPMVAPPMHQTHHHYYLNISVQATNLSDWRIESNRKNRFGSENRIEIFLSELECSSSSLSVTDCAMPRDAIRSSTSRLLRRAQCECTFRHFIGVSPMQFRHYYTCNNVRYAFQRIFSRFSWWSRVAKHLPYYFPKKKSGNPSLDMSGNGSSETVYDKALNWAHITHIQQAASWPATFARLRAFTRLLVLSATLAYLGQQ